MVRGQTRDAAVGVAMLGVAVWALMANFAAIHAGHGPAARARAELGAAPIEIHYAPAENLERIDVALIEQAGETIDIAAYVLTDWPVIDALADAADRGVRVRVWRDRSESEHGDPGELAKLAAAGAQVRVKPGGDLMHLKSYCVDGATLRTGAANFSASGEKRQDNDIVVIRDPAACAGFTANFERLWRP